MYNGDYNCPWKFKFILLVRSAEPLQLFARNRKERSIWMQTFCRVLDCLKGISPAVSGVKSEAYSKIMEREKKARKQLKYDPYRKQPKTTEVNGFISYQSETMLFNTGSVQGTLMKRN